MKKRTKLLAFLFALLLVVASLTACGNDDDTDAKKGEDSTDEAKDNDEDKAEAADEIYFLNFKPEIAEVYDKVAADYEEETGVKVKVVTAASGTYEQTLKSEMRSLTHQLFSKLMDSWIPIMERLHLRFKVY